MSNRSKLCVIIVLAFFCSSAWAGIGYVQGAHSAANYGSGSVSLTNTQAGDTILVAVYVNIGGTIGPPTDTQNNAWTADTNYYSPSSFNTGMQIWRASNIAGGNDTITVHQSNSGTVGNALVAVNAYEYSGLAISSPVDGVYAESSGCGTASGAAGSLATSNPNDLIFVFFADPGGSALSAGSGFTQRDNFTTSSDPMLVEDDIVTSTGIYAGTATVGGSLGCNAGVMVAYKAAGAVSAGMAYVQGAHSAASYGSGTVSFATTKAGDTILAAVFVNIGGTINPPTDTQNNIWTADTNYYAANSFNTGMQIWRASNIAGGSDTITVHQSNSGTVGNALVSVNAYEYSGLAMISPVDGSYAESSGCGTASGATGPVTTTNANDLLFAFFADPGGSPLSPGSGFTVRDSFTTGGDPMLAEHEIVSSTGTYTGTATVGGALGCNEGMMVAYKAAVGAISGTISGAGGNGATVTLSGAASATVTANSSGAYTFSGLASGSYTVTPSLSGFSFSPASQPVTVSSANVTGVNFSTVTYSLSGTISGAGGNGATVTLSGAASATVTANASGAYTFSGLASGAYTVAPSLSGFSFSPASQPVTISSANVTGVNFSTVTYSLSGTISGTGGNGATVTLSGAASATVTANASGAYTFSGLASGSYTVTPSLSGFSFSPASQPVTISSANVTGVNFSTVTYSLSGTISGAGGNGATVTLSGAASATVTANSSGAYTFSGLASGAYTVTPSLSGFSFSPASQPVTISSANVTGVNFSTVTYSLSGTISGAGGNGATVTLSGAASATVTANSSGAYTFSGLASGSYTVTPGLSGFSFSPASQPVTVSSANVTGVNFSTVTYTISGTISGAGGNGATVTLSGAASATVTANSSGAYTFTGLASGSYTVTPSLSGFSFTPASQNVTVSNANVTAVNFSTVTYTLSGTISGVGGSGATVTLSGAASATVTANASGAYTFTGLANGSYTVTPSLSGFSFSPASQPMTVSSANVTGVNFSTVTYTISGTISGAGGNGATVTLSGAASATVTANSSGAYTFSGLASGAYTVAPSLSGFSFSPASQPVTVSSANVTGVNFSTVTYSLSGTISGAGGNGATVTLSGAASATVTANSSGAYTFSGLASGSYTVTPSLSGFSFSPASQPVTVSSANVTGVNFSTVTYSLSGTISGAGGNGATVTLSGAASATVTANSLGVYTFSGLASGSYTVAPSLSGFSFSPASQPVTVSSANVTGVNFSTVTYSLSGTISGAGGNGATVTLSGAASATVTANSSGAYTFSGLASGTYTVTPSLSGFSFSPASQPVTISNANVTGVNFSTVTYSLSGTISGAGGNGATVTLSGAASATVTANSSGAYTFSGLASGAYTVTPSLSGFSFSPASQPVTISNANVTGVNFSTSASSTYTISGSLSPSANGSAATVTLSGAASATTTADASGNFSFGGLASGAYTVAASKAGFAISPASQAVTVSGASVTGVNFTAAIALAIDAVATGDGSVAGTSLASGALSTTSANELLLAFIASDAKTAGVTVTGVSGGGLTWTLVRRTNAQMGTAEVWRAFAPAQLSSVAVTATFSQSVVASITVVSFAGADATGANGAGAIGANASASAASGAPTASLATTRNNSWVFGVGDDWDRAVARTLGANQTMVHQLLAKSGDTYWVQRQNSATPLSGTSVTINDTAPTTDRYNLTIVEVLPPAAGFVATYGISGTLSPAAQGSGVTVTLSGAASATTTADSSGNYAFSGLANGSYTVTPAKSGIIFLPTSQTVTVDGFSLKAVNFSVLVPTWSLSGNLSPAASGSGATLTLGGAGSSSTTADSSGNYTFSGLANGTYSVTPSKSGYAFSPVAQSATISGANVANVNFTVSVAPIAVSISPAAVSLLTGGVQQFTATVTGTTNTAVTWTATGGTVTTSGRYTAPSTTGSYTVKATSVADTTKSASATVTVTTASSSTVLLGDANVETQVGSIPLGQAEAFQATATASGAAQSLVVYLDSTSTASQLAVGLYADASGHPGALLSQGSSTTPVAGAWNPIRVTAANLAAGTPYWIAMLGTSSGTLAFREATPGSCPSELEAQSSLTSLPASWTTGTVGSNCPASVFGDSTKVVFFDNFPGTTLSSYWTIISRHGEYAQSETECNVPQMVSVNNGLTITTEAQSASCGDYFTSPSSWPYITGDIQWTNLNFTYGSIEIEAKFPSVNTGLWPATWLLGSNCQYTNPLTGNTGVTINGHNCPNIGASGYTEIDMTECYGGSSGWCQFHVADPNFYSPCDGNYSVDTNFHTFTTIWNSSGITQYMDGTSRATCNQQLSLPMFLLIQTQTGGAGGTPNNSFLPAALVVTYVKVTQP